MDEIGLNRVRQEGDDIMLSSAKRNQFAAC